ncbi:MAG: MerR family transcriptional regulator [Blastocatellia bacterium]|nr:MerR family transcriptional regulator [Blastocatellia bacterium]
MTVSQLAIQSGSSPHAVRYYTRIGLLKPNRDTRNGYKLYSDSDVTRLRFIRQAKSLGFTLGEIAQLIRQSQKGESPCPLARRIIERRIYENREVLNETIELQSRMEREFDRWSKMPDGVPDGDSVCYLIESTGEPHRS